MSTRVHPYSHSITVEISGLAALALGFIFVGSKHGEVSEIILQTWRNQRRDVRMETGNCGPKRWYTCMYRFSFVL
jgi:hypothetical protein